MKTDDEIQKEVMYEIRNEPYINSSEISVTVTNGLVRLSGKVDSYYKKRTAEAAAKRVAGLNAVAGEIEVGIPLNYDATNTYIIDTASAVRL